MRLNAVPLGSAAEAVAAAAAVAVAAAAAVHIVGVPVGSLTETNKA